MFRVAVLLLVIVAVAAFAPAARVARSASLKMGLETEAGVTGPLGFFDPLGV